VLFSKPVEHGFIAGVMVNVLVLKAVYRGFIGGVMISMLVSKAVDRTHDLLFSRKTLICPDEPTSYCFREKNVNPIPMNSRSTAFETSAVEHGFIAGVMVNVLVLKAVDCGFIGGIMVSVLVLKVVDHYRFRVKHANHYATDEPTIYRFRDKHDSGRSWVHRWQVSILVSIVVDRGFFRVG
jgi:hypothetical protein